MQASIIKSPWPSPHDHTKYLRIIETIIEEVSYVVLGQQALIEKLLIALLADGHVLLEGVPGLAKTQVVSALGRAIGGSFRRVQLLPDMMPSDITGTLIYHPEEGRLRVHKGPILDTHFLLADEINRTPPKVQAAFLQAMQEREVTLGTDTFRLNEPFIVLATQNPVEEEGTYPLPEAQLDRFLFKLLVDYPAEAEEVRLLDMPALDRRDPLRDVTTVTSPAQLVGLCEYIKQTVHVSEQIKQYIVRLVRATRQPELYAGLQDLRGRIRPGVITTRWHHQSAQSLSRAGIFAGTYLCAPRRRESHCARRLPPSSGAGLSGRDRGPAV